MALGFSFSWSSKAAGPQTTPLRVALESSIVKFMRVLEFWLIVAFFTCTFIGLESPTRICFSGVVESGKENQEGYQATTDVCKQNSDSGIFD